MTDVEVEIVFALPETQSLMTLKVRSGSTVLDVVLQSGLLESHPDHVLEDLALGIWGREAERDQVIKNGDRIEIYRPLEIDPKEARRQLALSGQTMRSPDSG